MKKISCYLAATRQNNSKTTTAIYISSSQSETTTIPGYKKTAWVLELSSNVLFTKFMYTLWLMFISNYL